MARYRSSINSKGQVLIPAELRNDMRLKAGTTVFLERDDLRIIMRPVTLDFIRSLRGISRRAEEIREREHRDDRY